MSLFHRATARMRRFATIALCAFPPLLFAAPTTADPALRAPIGLSDAIQRVLARHPELAVFASSERALHAEAELAAQKPAMQLGVSAQKEFAPREGNGLEFSLTLASVFERGGRREARQALAQTRLDALANQQQAKRLDLCAEVARRYLDVVAAQERESIAATDVAQRERIVAAAARRVQAGATPQSVLLMTQAQLERARLEVRREQLQTTAAYRRLSMLWGEREPMLRAVQGDPLKLPDTPAFEVLAEQLERTPELQEFADEARIREARVQLARSQRTANIEWQVGVGRLQEGSGWGVLGSVSIPLGAARRAEPEIRKAQAELEALSLEREARELSLYATLAQAYGQIGSARSEIEAARDQVLPRLFQADAAAERAYRAGAISYLEWAQIQTEITAMQQRLLAAAIDAQRALIEIQRLTAQSFIVSSATASSGASP